MPSQPVTRTNLLDAAFDGARSVERVEIKRVRMAPNLASGLHLHPCPVVGVITEGSVLFQIEGEPAQVLTAGDAFFEPADVRVSHSMEPACTRTRRRGAPDRALVAPAVEGTRRV